MDKIIKTVVIIAGVFLVGFFIISISQQKSSPVEKATEEESFIQCLKEKDVTIYGSAWCPYCKQLAESLGGYEVVGPIYTECTEEEEKCRKEMIGTAVPEIQINGEMYKGSRDPERMAEATGCTYRN